MQASFDQVAEQLNLYGGRMQSMSQGILLNDADIMTIKAIIQIHNEALKLKNSDQLFEINEKLKKVSGLDGEDTTPTI
jgi:hypothetical protein